MNFEQFFSRLANTKVTVVGDVMLDTYWWGSVDRISPEAPVPVVALQRKELRVGGAANVALNTAAMGAKTTLISVIGKDEEGAAIERLLREQNIDTSAMITSADRISTNKTRIMSRNQQMMRLDAEVTTDLDAATEDRLIQTVTRHVETSPPDVLIFEDYNKGVLTQRVITELIAVCQKHQVITAVDPKRKNFFSFKGVALFKPNLKEVKEALNLLTDELDIDALKDIHEKLAQQLQHHISLITLSEKGVFYQDNKTSGIIPTHIRNVADVSGAGDTVIAVASLVYAATKDIRLTAEMANIAGGLVCEEVGTAAINKTRLFEECCQLLGGNVS